MMLISIIVIFLSVANGIIKITRADGFCKDFPLPKATFILKFTEEEGSLYIDQALNVTKGFSSFGKLIIIPERCPSRENLNYCEYLRNVTIPQFSRLMETPANPWKKTFTYSPPLGKPVKPGIYRLSKKKLDYNWSVISSKGYWRNKAIMMEEGTNDVIFCIYVEGEIR